MALEHVLSVAYFWPAFSQSSGLVCHYPVRTVTTATRYMLNNPTALITRLLSMRTTSVIFSFHLVSRFPWDRLRASNTNHPGFWIFLLKVTTSVTTRHLPEPPHEHLLFADIS